MGKFRSPRVVPREQVRSPKFESRRGKLLRDGCACAARVKLGMRNARRVHLTDIWSWYRVELRVGDHLGRSEELVSRCVECDLAEPEYLASLAGSAPGVVDGILPNNNEENNNDDGVVMDNDNNEDDKNENDDIQNDEESAEPNNDDETVVQNADVEETEETKDDNPVTTTGVDPEPLPPIQVQNEQTQRELNRIAWMGQQPATFAGRTHSQAREHATTNVTTTEHNTMTDFERDLFHRGVTGIQLPPEYEDQLATLKHTVLTQYTLKKGLQVFGPKGTEAVFAEMK